MSGEKDMGMASVKQDMDEIQEKDMGNQLEVASVQQAMGDIQKNELAKQLKEALNEVARLKKEMAKLQEKLKRVDDYAFKLIKENNHLQEKFNSLADLFTSWEPSTIRESLTDGSDWTANIYDDSDLTITLRRSLGRRVSQEGQRPSTSKAPNQKENSLGKWEGSSLMEPTTSTGRAKKRRSWIDILDLSTVEQCSSLPGGLQSGNPAPYQSAQQLTSPGSSRCEPSTSQSTLPITDSVNGHQFKSKIFFNMFKCCSCKQTLKYNTKGVWCIRCGKHVHLECQIFLPPCAPKTVVDATHAGASHAGAGSAAERNMTSLFYQPQSRSKPDTHIILADVAAKTPPMVPPILKHCINEIERRGKNVKELYRVKVPEHKLLEIQRRILRKVGIPYLGTDNIHVVCGCIIYFLSSLSEPVIPSTMWKQFVSCVPNADVGAISNLLTNLPQPNRDTVTILVKHMVTVSEYTKIDIDLDDLAEIFAPYIVGHGANKPADDSKSISVMKLICSQNWTFWKNLSKPKKDK